MLSDATTFWIAVALAAFWSTACASLLTLSMLFAYAMMRAFARRPCRHRRGLGFTVGYHQMARRRG